MISLSIILVTRNALPHIASAVRQARDAEAAHSTEVTAIDGDSTDGTWELLSENKHWKVRRQDGTGLAAARNQALDCASGEYIAFLDADDEWMPEKLSTQLRALENEPDADVVSCMLRKIGSDDDAELHPAWTPSGCLFRRRAFDRVGHFDTQYQIACDHEWFVRARHLNAKMSIIDECLLHKRIHDGNLSHDRGQYRKEMLTIFRNLG